MYLNKRDIEERIKQVLRYHGELRASQLVDKVRQYQKELGDKTTLGKKTIFDYAKRMPEVERIEHSHKHVVYRYKAATDFEIRLFNVVHELNMLLSEPKLMQLYIQESRKRWLQIKSKKTYHWHPLYKRELEQIAYKELVKEIAEARYGDVLMNDLLELSHKLQTMRLMSSGGYKDIPFIYVGVFRREDKRVVSVKQVKKSEIDELFISLED